MHGPWPLGTLPNTVIVSIGRQLVHRLAIGQIDITGDDFGTIFANAIGGSHRESPLGIADVAMSGNAWSVKTIKSNSPFTQKIVRLISGRNSPDYSLGIENLHADLNATGKGVLAIWNARVDEALSEHDDLRIAVLIRNMANKKFTLFEETATRYATDDYEWTKNKKGNLLGHEIATGEHRFTWQFHGSQFTVKRHVPGSAIKFKINKTPPIIELEQVLKLAKFKEEWIEIVN